MSEFVRFSLRIPNDTHEKLKLLADEDMRSLNTYIVLALDNHVKEQEKLKERIRKNYSFYDLMTNDEESKVAEDGVSESYQISHNKEKDSPSTIKLKFKND